MDMDIEPEADGFDLDPSFVSEYQADIFAYKREMEVSLMSILDDSHAFGILS